MPVLWSILTSVVVPMDDAQLIMRVACSDEHALRLLYERHAGRMYAITCRLLGNREEAEEIVQESFLDLWNRAATFEPGAGSAAGWIFTIARNRAVDRLRARATRRRTLEAVKDEVPPPTVTPERQTESMEARKAVARALAALSPEQRTVIEMAYFDGLSQSEIATRTGSPIGTVKGRTRAALEKLATLTKELA